MVKYTLGLDVGSNSIGWAMIADQDGAFEDGRKIIAGVRIFPEGVDNTGKKRDQPRGQERRLARGQRRLHQRRRQRKRQLAAILTKAGLFPSDPDERSNIMSVDPYPLRARGLDEPLSLHEFGRVLYHLAQRRGFKSNRKQERTADDGKVAKQTTELANTMEQAGCRTLGEYLAGLSAEFRHAIEDSKPVPQRVRNRYTLRSMYVDEFEQWWDSQRKFHPKELSAALKQSISDAIFFQRPLRFDPDVIGECELEEARKRCSRAHWLGQRFRMLQEVNNLATIDTTTGEVRSLTDHERKTLIEALETKRELKFSRIRTILGFPENQTFNLEAGGKRTKLFGNSIESALRSKLGKWYTSASDELRRQIHDTLADDAIQDDAELARIASDEWGLSPAQIEKLMKINLPTGHFRVSVEAIEKLIPYLEAGEIYSEARESAGYSLTKTGAAHDRLAPVDEEIKHLTNPLVHRGLSEVRKVINALIRQYGKPERIIVELARDMKNSSDRRRDIFFENIRRREENEAIKSKLRASPFNIHSPTGKDVLKYRLWEECNMLCPYTGKVIPPRKLFGPDIDIEHILPYSRTLDDSYMNKTLCFADENRKVKHNQTPYEAYNADPEKYEEIRQRIALLPWPKRRRFTQKEIDLDKFITRQLNDTRYMSRVVVGYLRTLGCRVGCTRGNVTAELRHQWGLNGILNPDSPQAKSRDDHRHHAVDAAVIALTTPSVLQRLAGHKYSQGRSEFPSPWDGFREQLLVAVEKINVSFRPARKIGGALHKQKPMGPGSQENSYVRRVSLKELTFAMVGKIRDKTIQSIVRQRLADCGISGRSSSIGKALTEPVLCMPSGVPIRRVRIEEVQRSVVALTRDAEGRTVKVALSGANHHVEIYRTKDDDGQETWTGRTVSTFEAHQRVRDSRPVSSSDGPKGTELIMSLCKDDMLLLTNPHNDSRRLYRVQKQSIVDGCPDLVFRLHTAARIDFDDEMLRVSSWKTLNATNPEKVSVDPIGGISPCND